VVLVKHVVCHGVRDEKPDLKRLTRSLEGLGVEGVFPVGVEKCPYIHPYPVNISTGFSHGIRLRGRCLNWL